MSKRKVVVVIGPTGVGKTALGIFLAKRLHAEVISGDSIQVYRGLDIGSAKVTVAEAQGIVHHLIDIKDPTEGYSVAEFQKLARSHMEQEYRKGRIPLIVGGTGLYIKAALYDYVFEEEKPADAEQLQQWKTLDDDALWKTLYAIDEAAAKALHPHNRQRVLRALIMAQQGSSKSERLKAQQHCPLYDAYIIGCTMERAKLYQRINERVESMDRQGLLEEVERLQRTVPDLWTRQCMQGIGYREWRAYFQDGVAKAEVLSEIQKHSRQFAKRQYTWFRNQMDVHWYDMEHTDYDRIWEDVQQWLNTHGEE